ncbi:group II intron reverse transcriptase/maturase [Vibrio vulnificus]|uniref:group II intron reverse transcriptase/maturase n=1 Tax=Vibrio vulnificus TaxID=672 RepID=UPI0009B5D77F|nr:group II intron reverse transcriptase/maturase [Vibrio vulnificus]EHU4928623.1 group II intron reverse transcriptase/maturase [Vibrio vulnificus]EIT7022354.1 group II intron reverse transcriptase/maturase [Vibrio vulnificus]EIV8620632.1 group II intron reverse transcriptase/maturase [Vibrio vulnificus]EKA7345486.1 group II intron reverse transcriptase/maturase [Vibrio vulnificus]EKL0032136.1 group II intron reverse transcriptase/maturase [Vibrio vulnificus]
MEQISASANLNHALRRVKRNKGCAGVDRLDITATISKLRQASNGQALRQSLLDGSYQPQPVLGIEIPKTNGGVRQLGIPTVLDRIVQQAITSVLSDIYEPKFSNSSYGFRPNRSAHHALAAASRYIREGRGYVVDIDLAKYFDTVNHDRLMHRLSKDIIDKRVLKLIRAYLQAGLMRDGLVERRQRGTSQGGPLSPLLSNIVLDELDKELERRGHKFCRYADDCQIYVRSEEAAHRVKESITEFLEQKLKLTVNREKSAATRVPERGYLSHSFKIDGTLLISKSAQAQMKKRVRRITKRNRGRELSVIITELTQYLRGWQHYFKLAIGRSAMQRLDEWIRRRLRCYRLKQRKRRYSIATWLQRQGVTERNAWKLAMSDKGWWHLALSPQVNHAMPIKWFEERGLYSLRDGYESLKVYSEPPYATHACTVV